MKMNPINLGVRFLLEMSALVAMGMWGWSLGGNVLKFIFALGIPIIAAAIWGTFNVLNDPSRSGKAPVEISGVLRLEIELTFFSIAVWMIYDLGYTTLSIATVMVVFIHYITSHKRVKWLLAH